MLAILQKFHSYLPSTANGQIDGQIFTGDQLTVERSVNVIASVANGFTPKEFVGREEIRAPLKMPAGEARKEEATLPTSSSSFDLPIIQLFG